MGAKLNADLLEAAAIGKLEKLKKLTQLGADINHRLSPLHPSSLGTAAVRGHLDVVNWLLENDVTVEVIDIINAYDNDQFEIYNILLDYLLKKEPDLLKNPINKEKLITRVIEKANREDVNGRTALMEAAVCGRVEQVKILADSK